MLFTLFIVHLIGLMSPGPDFFYISRKAVSSSLKNAIFASLGISLGIIFWALIALFGLTFISQSADFVPYLIMILGGSFLAYLGSKMLQVKQNIQFDESKTQTENSTASQEVLKGLGINLANGKAAVYFSSVLSGYTAELSSMGDSIAVLVMFVVTTFAYFSLVSLLFSRPLVRKTYAKYSRYIDNFAGIIFLFFGLRLIYNGVYYFIG